MIDGKLDDNFWRNVLGDGFNKEDTIETVRKCPANIDTHAASLILYMLDDDRENAEGELIAIALHRLAGEELDDRFYTLVLDPLMEYIMQPIAVMFLIVNDMLKHPKAEAHFESKERAHRANHPSTGNN